MEFRLLGTVAVATGSGELPLGPTKRRSLLAALLLRPNTAVPLVQLIDAVWPDDPPARARTVAQGHIRGCGPCSRRAAPRTTASTW